MKAANFNSPPALVIDGIIIPVFQSDEHEYTLATTEVAAGYGVSDSTIKEHKRQHADELQEGKHFLEVRNPDFQPGKGGAHTFIHWTKRGIVRLGFFIRSERAKRFRDMAEDLVIDRLEAVSAVPEIDLATWTPALDLAGKIARFQPQTPEQFEVYRLMCEYQDEIAARHRITGEPRERDQRGLLLADIETLLKAIVEDRDCDAVILPASVVLDIIHQRKLLQWIFPVPRDLLWHNTKAEQSRFGKFLRREIVGKEFRTTAGIVRVMRHPSSRHSILAFICDGREAA